jgi:hypothetical protein
MEEKSKEISVRVPNIFDYATGELSQDAFICWLIKLADCEGHELQAASKEFIALLCRIGGKDKDVSSFDVSAIQKLSQQKEEKIDVFFIAVIKGNKTCFIIEDKVDSQPHSGQLQRYYDHVLKKYPEHSIVKIYFKTGYLFENDSKECEKAEYGILDYRTINNFLFSVKTQDVIFTSYRDFIHRKFFNRYEEGLKAMKEESGHQLLNNDFIQYEFVKLLSDVCQETIGPKNIKTGVSLGSDKWAHYRFIWLKDALGEGKHERVWYRIEPRKNKGTGKNCFCLSIRQFSEDLNDQQKKIKLDRLRKYKEIFKEISGKTTDIVFTKPQVDRTGSNSSEISLLFFDGNKNSIQNVLEYLPVIHKEFVSTIQQVSDDNFHK